MRRLGLSAVLATALAASGAGSAPAVAQNNDVARTLAGLAGLAVFAAILHDRAEANADRKARKKAPVAQTRSHNRNRHVQAGPDYSQCLRQRQVGRKIETFVSNRCVNRLNRAFNQRHHADNGRRVARR